MTLVEEDGVAGKARLQGLPVFFLKDAQRSGLEEEEPAVFVDRPFDVLGEAVMASTARASLQSRRKRVVGMHGSFGARAYGDVPDPPSGPRRPWSFFPRPFFS